jgi:hypothetical protein
MSGRPDHAEAPLAIMASGGVVYAALLLAWLPQDLLWASVAWAAAVGWIMCATAFAASRHPQAGRWAAVCGLLAGGFTGLPWAGDPSMAALFRVLLPIAVRRALRLTAGDRWWELATLVAAVALPIWPAPAGTFVLVAAAWTGIEYARLHWSWSWARPVAACIVLPALVAASELFGVARFAVGSGIVATGILAFIVFASTDSARRALPPTKGASAP